MNHIKAVVSMHDASGAKAEQQVQKLLLYADSLGLEASDYKARYDRSLRGEKGDSLLAYRDAVTSLLYDAAYGRDPGFQYNSLITKIDSALIQREADELAASGNWRRALNNIEPTNEMYKRLKKGLLKYTALEKGDTLARHRDFVIRRLRVYGLLSRSQSDSESVKVAVKCFQTLVAMDTTGIADNATMTELSIPIHVRVGELKKSLNYMRWINRLADERIVLVNIPSARLQILSQDISAEINMKVILGKVSWQTPIFAAYIDGITTYPYWIVPKSIAVKEILPKVRRNIGWLEASNIQVLNQYGQIVNPRRIAWYQLSARYFPYTLRQSTGCDNSLGVMMFNINSPYSVYLHDTNIKDLFNSSKRFLSHGCVRVENAMALAEAIAGNELPSTTLEQLNNCLKDQMPQEIKLQKSLPLLIVYMRAADDENGELRFYPDVYGMGK